MPERVLDEDGDADAPAPAAARHPSLRSVTPHRYSEFRVLGQGGMGIVYWAIDTDLNRQVAFKVVRPDAGESAAPTPVAPIELSPPVGDTPVSKAFATLKARFLQEAWVTAGLEHPGIVPVYEIGSTEGGVPYYTMRFVRGSRTFAAAIAGAKGGTIDERLALLEPFLKICDTIRYAHAHGVVHRDLKPDNIALGEFGEVVVLDWGLATMIGRPDAFAETWQVRLQEYRDAADLKTMAHALGTPGYMAPEAAFGRVAEVDARSDVYSLGAILFQVLAGRLPHTFATYAELAMQLVHRDAPTATSLDASVPAELSDICAKALARDRGQRTPTVDALADDVRGWLARRAADREIDALRAQATAAFDAASELEGDPRLHQLDRAASACDQVLSKRADDPASSSLRRDIDALRARGVEERASATRRTALRRAGVAALVFLVVAGALVGKALDDRRAAAESATSAKDAALRRVTEAAAGEREALRRARALGLESAADTALDVQPMRALLLAREAVRMDESPATTHALRRALAESRERVLLRGHRGGVVTAAFSADGARIVTASSDATARVWDAAGRELAVLRGHADRVVRAAFSPDGTKIVTASWDGTARVWDLSGREVAVLRGHEAQVVEAAFSPDGSKIVTASSDRTARVWDLSGNELAVLRGHEDRISGAAFSPDGARIVTSSADRTARVWDLSGKEIAALRGHEQGIDASAFSPDSTRIVTACADRTARVWDVAGKEIAVLRGHDAPVRTAAFSPDGTRIVTGSDDKTARVWDLAGDELADLRGHENGITSAAFSPDGTKVVTASFDMTARVWDLAGRPLAVLRGHDGAVPTAAFAPGGARILTASWDGTARVWDLADKELVVLRGHEGAVHSASYSPDGAKLVTSSADRTARVWDAAGTELAVLRGHTDKVSTARFSPDGSRIVTAGFDGTIRVWDLSGKELLLVHGPSGWVLTAAFSPDGTKIVTAHDDATARVWDSSGNALAVLRGHENLVRGAEFSPDGSRIVTASWDKTARVWDLAGRELVVLRGHETFVDAASFSPDGTRIVTASEDKTARVWSASGEQLAVLRGHAGPVYSAAFSRDGTRIVTASVDRTARVWDPAGGQLAVLRGHDGWVISATFSPDGSRVVTAGEDKTARVCLVRTEDVLKLADGRITRDFTEEELGTYTDLLPFETKERARAAIATVK